MARHLLTLLRRLKDSLVGAIPRARRERFHAGFVLAFGLAIVWGVSLYSSDSTPARHWWGWFKNDLAHSVFHVIVLPVIVGLVAATLDATLLDRLKPGAKQLAIALLCVLVLLPIPSVYENMHAQPRAPFMLMPTSGQAAAYEFDR